MVLLLHELAGVSQSVALVELLLLLLIVEVRLVQLVVEHICICGAQPRILREVVILELLVKSILELLIVHGLWGLLILLRGLLILLRLDLDVGNGV